MIFAKTASESEKIDIEVEMNRYGIRIIMELIKQNRLIIKSYLLNTDFIIRVNLDENWVVISGYSE